MQRRNMERAANSVLNENENCISQFFLKTAKKKTFFASKIHKNINNLRFLNSDYTLINPVKIYL